MNNPIDSTGIFDSRDLIEYKEFLENEILDNYIEWAENHNNCDEAYQLEIPDSYEEIEFINEEAFTQAYEGVIKNHKEITDFCEELENYGGFEHGESIISEDYFTEYSKELCNDAGYVPDNLPTFIENNIDWSGVADDLRVDYTTTDYQGQTYLMRA